MLQPGDVLNVSGSDLSKCGFFEKIGVGLATKIICADQRHVFGRDSDWRDHHTMIYFDPDHVFSIGLPKPKYLKISEWDQSKEVLTVYRYAKRDVSIKDASIMWAAADEIIGADKPYDIGQLLDILIATINGYPYKRGFRIFDFGRKNLVCSVGVASIYNRWRHRLWEDGEAYLPQLFSRLRAAAWPAAFVNKFNRQGFWDIQKTTPANFANTQSHYDGEFNRVGSFLHNVQI